MTVGSNVVQCAGRGWACFNQADVSVFILISVPELLLVSCIRSVRWIFGRLGVRLCACVLPVASGVEGFGMVKKLISTKRLGLGDRSELTLYAPCIPHVFAEMRLETFHCSSPFSTPPVQIVVASIPLEFLSATP